MSNITWGDWRRDWLIELVDELGYELENWPLLCGIAVSHHQEDMDMDVPTLKLVSSSNDVREVVQVLAEVLERQYDE